VVHFVAGQGMTKNFLEALNSRKWLRDFSGSIRAFHPSSIFKPVLSLRYKREMHAVHFHKIGCEEFPSSFERKNHKGGEL
jgi:hypothetical protein